VHDSIKALKDPKNRRRVFEDFAKAHNFDALNPNNWLSKSKQFLATKVIFFLFTHPSTLSNNPFTQNAAIILHYHGESVKKALKELFPEVDWKATKGRYFYGCFCFCFFWLFLGFF
jgi:hypothetical protein